MAKDQTDITLNVTASARKYIASAGFSDKFGARPIKRMIQDKIENTLAEMILEEKLPRGGAVTVTKGKGEDLSFKVK